jgi:hypothetical protein
LQFAASAAEGFLTMISLTVGILFSLCRNDYAIGILTEVFYFYRQSV